MDKMKQIQTDKCKLLAVMVPEGASDLTLPKIGIVDLYFQNKNGNEEDYISITIPEGNWQTLGLATELTEEEWRMFVPQLGGKLFDGDLNNYYSYPDFLTMDHPFDNKLFSTAKESGLSLLEANQCYSVNPYPKDWISYAEWQEAESNTGRWLILRHVS